MSSSSTTCPTRQRILEAAGELFANQGYKNVSVREICALAGANHAAVNYHFRDKETLYAEVLLYASRCATDRFPPDEGLNERATPEQRLRAYVQSTLRRVLDEGRPAWHGKLLSREMVEPTGGALDDMVSQEAYPRALMLGSIVRSLLGPRADAQLVDFCMMNIIGQCAFHRNAAPYIERIAPMIGWNRRSVEELTEDITRFTLHALRGLAAELSRPGGKK